MYAMSGTGDDIHDGPDAAVVAITSVLRSAGPEVEAEQASAKGQEAYRILRDRIDRGQYPPGTRLKEVALAEELGMSRTPVREAFRQLERDGSILIAPNRGAVVRTLATEDLDDIYDLRAVIEGFCASRAATRMDPSQIAQLVELNEEFDRQVRDPETSIDTLIRLNDAFHGMIVDGSRSARVGHVLEKAIIVPVSVRRGFWTSPHAREMTSVYHREIVEAIRARDAVRAEAVMRSHVYAVKDDFLKKQRAANMRSLLNGPDA
jgi:DNA-binding GntR family transcriptional regulator